MSPNHFQGFGTDLEELKISDGTDHNVKGLKNHAFRDVRGLKKLDLSENSISSIENDAFTEVKFKKKKKLKMSQLVLPIILFYFLFFRSAILLHI